MGGLRRGLRVVRAAPWRPLVGTSAGGGLLLLAAVLRPHGLLAAMAATLGLATCGGAAAYVLDEESAPVLDATPSSRGRRVRWRLGLLLLPALVAGGGVLGLDRRDPASGWAAFGPFAVGALAGGVALAACLRRAGVAAPGDLAAAVTVATLVLAAVADPLRRWVSLVPLGDPGALADSTRLWAVLVTMSGAAVALAARDPAARAVRHRR